MSVPEPGEGRVLVYGFIPHPGRPEGLEPRQELGRAAGHVVTCGPLQV